MRLVEVISLTLVGGKRVKLFFSNGQRGRLDLTDLLGPGFDEEFGMVVIEDGDLVWPSGATLKAERLYLDAEPEQGWRGRLLGSQDSWDQSAAALSEQSKPIDPDELNQGVEAIREVAAQVQHEAVVIGQAVDKAARWAADQVPYQVLRQGLRWLALVPYVHQAGARTISAHTARGLKTKVHKQLVQDFWDHPEVLQQMIEEQSPDL